MPDKQLEHIESTTLLARASSEKSPPPWLASAILLLHSWKERGLLKKVQDIHCYRPIKQYVFCDLVLVLLVMALSQIPALRPFYREMWPWQQLLASVWERGRLPSRSHLCRLLRAVTLEQLQLLRALFRSDLAGHFPEHALLGMHDSLGQRHLFFDMDPTRMASRERQLEETPQRPNGQRARTDSTAPGYSGRKRAQKIRSRTTVHCPHAGMWLLTLGQPGNGNQPRSLSASCQEIQSLSHALAFELAEAILRMDGEWGHLKHVSFVKNQGIGYLTRVSQYSLLRLPEFQAALAAGSTVQMEMPDSAIKREVFDIPDCCWENKETKLNTRFVVTRRAARRDGKKESVGCRIGEWVYEIFTTDRSARCWRAEEVVSLYLWRGAFEAVLGQEDAEMQTDRWISSAASGEDLWQIICQWVWNQKVQLGLELDEEKERSQRLLSFETPVERIEADPVHLEIPVPKKEQLKKEEEKAKKEGLSREPVKKKSFWGPEAFRRGEDGVVYCPEEVPMRRVDKRQRVSGWKERFEAPAQVCAVCERCKDCRRPGHSNRTGRKVDLPREPIEAGSQEGRPEEREEESEGYELKAGTERQGKEKEEMEEREVEEEERKSEGKREEEVEEEQKAQKEEREGLREKPRGLQWYDIAASFCRRKFEEQVKGEQVKVRYEERKKASEEPPVLETRDKRAHRRLTWAERLQRNARPADAPRIFIEITGVPPPLARATGLLFLEQQRE